MSTPHLPALGRRIRLCLPLGSLPHIHWQRCTGPAPSLILSSLIFDVCMTWWVSSTIQCCVVSYRSVRNSPSRDRSSALNGNRKVNALPSDIILQVLPQLLNQQNIFSHTSYTLAWTVECSAMRYSMTQIGISSIAVCGTSTILL